MSVNRRKLRGGKKLPHFFFPSQRSYSERDFPSKCLSADETTPSAARSIFPGYFFNYKVRQIRSFMRFCPGKRSSVSSSIISISLFLGLHPPVRHLRKNTGESTLRWKLTGKNFLIQAGKTTVSFPLPQDMFSSPAAALNRRSGGTSAMLRASSYRARCLLLHSYIALSAMRRSSSFDPAGTPSSPPAFSRP